MTLSGSPLDYLFAFGGGILVSFTPCVYPFIPVILGFIGIKGSTSRFRGFILSMCYSLGVAFTYSILGMVSVLSGRLFGEISSNPFFYFLAGNICIFFGLYMLEVFNLSLPGISLGQKAGAKDLFSIFILGASSGLVIGSCTTPALGAILVYVAGRQNLFYGMGLLFSFALGMCAVLILVGTFGGLLISLPKSGRWSTYIKKICGLILILAGEYFLITGGRLLA